MQGGRPETQTNLRAEAPPWLGHCSEFFAGISYAVLILDASGHVTYANPAAVGLFGRGKPTSLIGLRYDEARLLGGSSMRVVDDRGRPVEPARDHPVEDVLKGAEATRTRLSLETPSGRQYLLADVVPLRSSLGEIAAVGVLYAEETEDVARRSESEWLRGELVASRLEVEEVLRLSEALNTIGEMIHSTLDFDQVLRRVVHEATLAIRAHSGLILVREDDGWVPRVRSGLTAEILGDARATLAAHADIVAARRAPLVVHDASQDERFAADVLRRLEVRGFVAVPLLSRGDTVDAVLSFHNPFPTGFSAENVRFAVKVATTTSLAMENARAYTEERHIAETLQRTLLVVPDRVHGVEFAHLYQSATEAAWVGGDFFDLFELPGGRIGVVIGDVSGKGVEASALASFTRQLLKAHAQDNPSPSHAMSRTNDLVYRSSRTEEFVTVFFGILSLADGGFTYCNAGHPPPVVYRGSAPELVADWNPIIGGWERTAFEDSRTTLEPGDSIVLYTDGVIEAKRDRELFGEDRLLHVVERIVSEREIKDIPRAILGEVSAFANGRLQDDVAIMCVRRTSGE